MIENERRSTAIGLKRTQQTRYPTDAKVSEYRTVTVFGCTIQIPHFVNSKSVMMFISIIVFVCLLVFPIYPDAQELSNCFAILVFSTLLWAFEVSIFT